MDRNQLESLLRQVELQKLYRSSSNKHSTDELYHMSLELCRSSRAFDDPRFLNAALKLNDKLEKNLPDAVRLATLAAEEQQSLVYFRNKYLSAA